MFIIVWQVWLGEIGKNDIKMLKKIKKQIVNNGIYEKNLIWNVYIF